MGESHETSQEHERATFLSKISLKETRNYIMLKGKLSLFYVLFLYFYAN